MGKGTKKKNAPRNKAAAEDGPAGPAGAFFVNRTWAMLAGLFILGLFLRLYEISRKSLWLDEASTYFLTTQPDLLSVIAAASRDHHAPLHFVTVWIVRLFGSSEFALRFPSAVAGALTVIAIFFIAKEIWDDDAGLIAAALLAVSPYHILYSQEARMYGMVVLFVALAVWMFLRATRTGGLYDWLLFGGACALSFYTHFYSAFAIVALAAAYFIVRFNGFRKKSGAIGLPPDFRNYLAGMALSFVLVLPVLGSFFSQSGYFIAGSFNWGLSMGSIPFQTVLMFSFYIEIVAVIFVVLVLAGLFLVWQKDRARAAALAVILVLPVIFSMYLSQIIPFNVRYHLYLIVVFLSLAAVPLAWAGRKIPGNYGTYAVIVALLLVSAFPLSAYYAESYQDWKGASATLSGLAQPGDAVAPLPWTNYLPLSYYYDNTTGGTHYRNFPLTTAGFHELDNENGSVYFVITLSDLSAQGDTAFSESLAYLNDHAKILSGSSAYDILIAQKTS